MKETPMIKVIKRELMTKGEIRELRESGMIPASISARGEDSINISVNRNDLMKLLSEHGRSSMLQLDIGSKTYDVMVKEMQTEPLTFQCINVTFQHVFLDEETKAEVPVRVHGKETLAQKGFEFLQQLDKVSVTGLPNDIPAEIPIDVSNMEAGDTLYLKDMALPEGIQTDMETDRVVFSVSYPRAAVVEESQTEAASAEVPLVGSQDDKPEA